MTNNVKFSSEILCLKDSEVGCEKESLDKLSKRKQVRVTSFGVGILSSGVTNVSGGRERAVPDGWTSPDSHSSFYCSD